MVGCCPGYRTYRVYPGRLLEATGGTAEYVIGCQKHFSLQSMVCEALLTY